MEMKWYALYADGKLRSVKEWYGTPTVRDFGVGEIPSSEYQIIEVVVSSAVVGLEMLKIDLTV